LFEVPAHPPSIREAGKDMVPIRGS
jgi:hypothetical protein